MYIGYKYTKIHVIKVEPPVKILSTTPSIMGADVKLTQGARASAAMVLA